MDNLAVELDKNSRHLLVEKLRATQVQAFATVITLDYISDLIDYNSKIFYLKQGNISVFSKAYTGKEY
jgi:recombinational DNA repair ATPase RecF